ncbi:ATP-binding cassette domain-containing protein [Spongisporangium articulatum]|uniref:ATP-binding cassette domain-containing protein n=1 Tax=Spongisporangium articulatum TaxID=3362603 RepID=A0ABW8AJK5_9ACTN
MGVTVELRGWGWRHAGRKAWAVRGVDLVLQPGERVLLLGASGAGKSTLLAGIAGLLDPANSGEEEGELLLDGVPARRARRLATGLGSARTGLLLQDPYAQTVLERCGDDVAFGCENHRVPRSEIWARVDAALALVGFPYGRAHSTASLSGGERQRLALAGALALRPDLLLLDEPTAMLDPDGAELVRGSVAEVLAATGAGCLVVEHRVEPWLPSVDRVVVLDPGGGVLADGAPEAVFTAAAAELDASGVWTPGLAGDLAARLARGSGATPGPELIRAEALAVSPAVIMRKRRLSASIMRKRRIRSDRPDRRRPVLAGVDVSVSAGAATCLTGPNGTGKSTLALTLAGLLPPVAGRVVAAAGLARGLGEDPYRWRAPELAARVGTVFQDPRHQFVAATVRDELLVGPSRDPVRADELLDRLRLRHLARANPFTLSGGEQRRLSVATALATAPGLLVLDEPTFGQDARTWAELVAALLDLLDGGTGLLVATHDLELARVLSTRGAQVRLAAA